MKLPELIIESISTSDLLVCTYDDSSIGLVDKSILRIGRNNAYDTDIISEHILASSFIRYNNKYDAIEIEAIHATRGYGSILTMVIMSYMGGWLIWDTTDRITNDALRLIRRFYDGDLSHTVKRRKLNRNSGISPAVNYAIQIIDPLSIPSIDNKWRYDYESLDLVKEEMMSQVTNSMRSIYK